jgi:hypothetical protein
MEDMVVLLTKRAGDEGKTPPDYSTITREDGLSMRILWM